MKKILGLLTVLSTAAIVSAQTTVVLDAGTNGTTVNTCLGSLFDSGGTGASTPYSNNESYVVTICPDVPGNVISLQWTTFNLDPTDNIPGPGSDADNITIYDGDNTGAPTLGTYTSGQITPGAVFQASPGNPTGCLTIEFNSNANGTGDYNAAISCDVPCDNPNAMGQILGGIANDSIAVCVGDPVLFEDNGSTAGTSGNFSLVNWVWQWQDGTPNDTLNNPGQVSHSFDTPGQYVVQLTVIDDNDCVNLNSTDLQVFVSPYPTFDPFPADTLICLGESVTLEAFPDQYEVTWSGFPLSVFDDDNCMHDNQIGVPFYTPMTITGYDPAIQLNSANPDIFSICVDIEHSFLGDFVLQVQCPTGQVMTLHQQGGGGTNLGAPDQGVISCTDPNTFGTPWNYCFTPTATETWVEAVNLGWAIPNGTGGNSLPPGDYEPVDPFSALDGCPINGTWNLIFIDNWLGDDGSIPSWSINFDPVLNPAVTTFTPQIGTASDSSYWNLADPWIVSNTPDLNSITVTPGAAGVFTYTYTVENSFGCTYDTTVNVEVYESATTAVPDTAVCDGNPVQLNAGSEVCEYTLDMIDTYGDGWNGGYLEVITSQGTFTYDIPFGSTGNASFFVPTGENWTLQFFPGGWAYECEFTITDPGGGTVYQDGQGGTTPTGALQAFTADCPGNETYMALNGYTYIWDPPAGLNNPNIASPIYSGGSSVTLTVTLYPTGHPDCAQVDTVQIDLGGGLNPGLDSIAMLCFEGPNEDLFNWLGGTPQTGGTWIDPLGAVITMPITPATATPGLYEYRVDSAGCTASAFVDVQIFQVSGATTVTDSDCQACNGEILVTPSGGNLPYQYSIDGGITYQASDTFAGLCGGTTPGTNYAIIIEDSLGCVGNVADDVVDTNFPQIDNAVVIDSDCQADNGQVDVATTSSGGTTPYTYSVDGVTAFGPLPLTNLPPSSPTYDLILQDANGCTDTVQITILEINVPTLDPVVYTDATCFGVCDGTVTLTGTNLANYSVDNGTTNQANGNFTGLCPGTYDILVDNGFGCSITDQVTIVEPPVLDITSISPDIELCPGEVVSATVTGVNGIGNVTFTWESGGNVVGTGSPADITYNGGGDMVVCATMADDCPTTDSACFTISEPAPAYPMMTSDRTNGCEPLTVTFYNLTNTSVATTTWTFSNGTTVISTGSDSITVLFEDPGLYDVSMEVITTAGCVYDTTYAGYIEVFANPTANYNYNPIPATIYDSEVSFINFSSDDVTSWDWQFGLNVLPNASTLENPTVNYPEGVAGNYPVTLIVTNDNGCTDSVSGTVVVANEVVLYAPNVFTPDGDEFNEGWRVYITGIDIYDFHLTMFNRWGEIIWESYNTEAIWSGHYGDGGMVQDGTYVWVIEAKDSYTDKKYEFRGHVTVLK